VRPAFEAQIVVRRQAKDADDDRDAVHLSEVVDQIGVSTLCQRQGAERLPCLRNHELALVTADRAACEGRSDQRAMHAVLVPGHRE
jgi:hypothetical protein